MRTFGDLERNWVTLSRTLPALVPHLHRVTALNILTDTAIIRTQTCIFGPLFGQLHSITELSVSEFGQATWSGEEKNTLSVFLNHFPGLQSLFMRTVTGISYQPDDEVTMLSTTGPAFSLKTLHLGGCSDFWTLAWLLRAPYSLRRLRLAGVGGGEVEHIKRILSVVGANLLELSIYEHSMCSAQTSSTLHLAATTRLTHRTDRYAVISSILAHANKVCTGLYQLHIGRFDANKRLGSSQTTYAFNHCSPSQMLAGVAMGSLVHLSLGLCLVGDDGNQTDTEACDWGRLDQLLSRSFAKLRQVVIDVSPEGSTEGRLSLEKRIRDAMPWLSASLVLEMTFSQF